MSIACMLLFLSVLQAQKKSFTYEQLFSRGAGGQAPALSKPLPMITGWVDDSHYIEMRKSETDGKMSAFSVDAKTGAAVPYTAPVKEATAVPAGPALAIKDARNQTLSPDKQWAAYTKPDNNLYLYNIAAKTETQVTKDGSETILNGYASWVYYEEILGRGSRYKAFWWSGDSKKLCYMRFDDAQVPVFPIYWSDGQHGKLENTHYPKVGDKNPEVNVGIVNVAQPTQTIWTDFNPKDDQYFGAPVWTPSNELWVQWMNRGQDNLKIYNIDLATGKKAEIYDEKQKTWIDLDEASRTEFLSDGKSFIMKSDKDGWENLYLYSTTGQLINQITTGNFWGTSIVRIDEKNKEIGRAHV